MPSYSFRGGAPFASTEEYFEAIAPYAPKFAWFLEKGYQPHTWQARFYTMSLPSDEEGGRLCHYRHLVAGRQGGKTLSAAWEVLYYALHPAEFHWDTRHEQRNDPLWIQVLVKDYPTSFPSLRAFRQVLQKAGLVKGLDYEENRGDRFFEFPNGTLIQWKTAVDPESLRGASLDLLWIDEAAFITSPDAFNVIHPALMQRRGSVICTTTPKSKNWYYEEFFGVGRAAFGKDIGSVEYRSIDNPYFPRSAWELEKRRMPPMLFKQEYEASFDSMAGKELPGEWLQKHFYNGDDLARYKEGNRLKLQLYMGVDPAISLADTADRFAAAILGVPEDQSVVFLLELFAGRISFADQVDFVREWHIKYRPHLIGIEAQAYQAALTQQTMRLENLPPIVPMMAQGKKSQRILSMSPLFKVGKVRVRADHRDFIEEWVDYDSTLKNPKDDTLDAVEIALRTAGALLPIMAHESIFDVPLSSAERIKQDLPGFWTPNEGGDEHLGSEW